MIIFLYVFSFFSVYKWFKNFQKTTPILISVPENTSQPINNNNIFQDDKQKDSILKDKINLTPYLEYSDKEGNTIREYRFFENMEPKWLIL
ncbi:putative outer surface lipoprotein [Candidatus Phytoplasma pruni]|uniref:Putative outer surface lipoprotein n=1 Tax=Candidatus Phytoplasma pruni TaxID=479893 RepID=A0A0M1N0Q5_9MOLU|nr:putative outer surface lipoprotein [Candidatus Phytoplasma pruni]